MKNPMNIPLVRQIVGAVVGASLALLLYQGYQTVAPGMTALLKISSGSTDARFAEADEVSADQVKYQRQEARNRVIAEHFAAPETFDRIAERAKNVQLNLTDEQRAQAEAVLDNPAVPGQMAQIPDTSIVSPGGRAASGDTITAPVGGMAQQREEVAPAPSALAASVGEEERDTQPAGERLPASGVGLWAGLLAAFALTAAMRWRLIMRLRGRNIIID